MKFDEKVFRDYLIDLLMDGGRDGGMGSRHSNMLSSNQQTG